MPARNRDTLKYFFSDGAMPSADMFADLIDSMVNMEEEGFRKTAQHGLEISNKDSYETLLSFFRQQQPDTPVWQFRFNGNDLVLSRLDGQETSEQEISGKENYSLNFGIHNNQPALGVGVQKPKDCLHLSGYVRAAGRRGSVSSETTRPPADGDWHTIAGPFKGCQVIEVVARAKSSSRRRYAVMHAIATHTQSPARNDLFQWLRLRNPIRYTQAFYDSYLHRLKLRWRPGSERGEYFLQIRTNWDYGADSVIDFHIANLWSDTDFSL